MTPVVTNTANSKTKTPRILVVDDEPTLIELVGDVVGRQIPCKLVSARTVAEAKQVLTNQSIELMVADVMLPDGEGTALLSTLRKHQPAASAIVITGQPSVDGAIAAIREGAIDFLPKPFTAESLVARVNKALEQQAQIARKERRFDRLKDAVRRLSEARRMVTKKVDLLCNDLVSAYGELSRQLDLVRTQESFRKTLAEANDLEQLLCHAMDWMLRQMGYANVALWLAGEEPDFQLGAYIKYTTPGDPEFTDAMKNGLLPIVVRDGFVHLGADEAAEVLSPIEAKYIEGQTILAVNCTYLGETLAAIVLFRDGQTVFTDEDAAVLKAISSVFAVSLATNVKGGESYESEDGENPFYAGDVEEDDDDDGDVKDTDDKKKKGRRKKDDAADWWKRGEAPPF